MLTPQDRAEIARLRAEDPQTWTMPVLGKKFGVSKQRIFVILNPGYESKYHARYAKKRKEASRQ